MVEEEGLSEAVDWVEGIFVRPIRMSLTLKERLLKGKATLVRYDFVRKLVSTMKRKIAKIFTLPLLHNLERAKDTARTKE